MMRALRRNSVACGIVAAGLFGMIAVSALVAATQEAEEAAAPAAEESPAEEPAAEPKSRPYDPADWRDAGIGEDQLGTAIRTCTIRMGADGILHGKIFRIDENTRKQTPIKQIELRLVQEGKLLEMVQPDQEEGAFQFSQVKPGIYSLIGQGADGFVAFSFHVELPPDEDADGDKMPLDAEGAAAEQPAAEPETPEAAPEGAAEPGVPVVHVIQSCAMDPVDMPMAIQLIQSFLGTASGGQPAGSDELDAMAEQADADEAMEAAEEPKSRPDQSLRAHHDAGEVPITALSWHAVTLQEDGSLIGRVRMLVAPEEEDAELQTVPPKDMRVFLLQKGKSIAQAPCSELGVFLIPDVEPGIYSFVGVGLDGFTAMTIDVLPAKKEEDENNEGGVKSASLRRISLRQNLNNLANFYTTGVPPVNFGQVQNDTTTAETNNNQVVDTGPLLAGLNGNSVGNGSGNGSSSPTAFGNAGGGSGMTAPTGGAGGGAGGGGGGFGNGNLVDTGVPEIDPASSGVGLSVLIGLLFLLVDLYRPR